MNVACGGYLQLLEEETKDDEIKLHTDETSTNECQNY